MDNDKKVAKFAINSKAYDRLKLFAMIWLPALGAAYFSLASIWGFPFAEQVLGTIVVVETFLGAALGISKKSYDNAYGGSDGTLIVDTTDPLKDTFNLEVDTEFDDLKNKSEIKLIVRKQDPGDPQIL